MEYDNKRFLDWIGECNRYDLSHYLKFKVDGHIIGYVNKNYAKSLLDYPHILTIDKHDIQFVTDINDFDYRTAAMAELCADLYERQLLKSWVGEHYDVAVQFGQPAFFSIERAAATQFGISKYGVHLNAYVLKDGQYYLWVAKRSLAKPTWPGKLDHLVAGGHASNMTIHDTLIKECGEEAGMSTELAQQARAVSLVDYITETGDKLSRDTLFIYDICLSESFIPENTDGEVEEFYLWPIEKVLQRVNQSRDYKTNCNLVIIDFAVRHGFIHPDQPYYMSILKGLRDNGIKSEKLDA